MPHSRIFTFSLLAALCGTSVLGADPDPTACNTHAVAGTDESCATIAELHGIDISDFIKLNPSLVSCVLIEGMSYCVGTTGTATATATATTSSSAAASSPTGDLIPSPDGSDGVCGNNYTCLGSVYGDCCSQNGYCGNTTEYCGEGCNSVFGRCSSGADPTSSATEAVTVVAEPDDCTVTLISVSTATETVSAVRAVTITATATETVSAVRAVTITVTATVTRRPMTTEPSTPRPILDGTIRSCTKFYQLTRSSDSCSRIARSNDISVFQLYNWNPNLDCDYPEGMAGYYICVGV